MSWTASFCRTRYRGGRAQSSCQARFRSLSFLSGAYAPEFGAQTAAILDITTLPGAKKPHADVNFQGGAYDTTNGDLTWEGPLGKVRQLRVQRRRQSLAQRP